MKGRLQNSLMNVLTGIFGQFFSYILSFIIRSVFIYTLGEVYLGLNGLYSNILSVLNLAELGLGTAIVVELYRTVGQKDDEKTKEYLDLYRKAYYVIGCVILFAGLVMLPFLDNFINDKELLNLIDYRLVFVLYLINTVFSYFFMEYRMSIVQANQVEYKCRIISYAIKLVEMVLQVVSLLCLKNIYVYLIIPIVLGCFSTSLRGFLIGKWYPIVKDRPLGKLSKEEKRKAWKNILAVSVYKISGTVINSTDNIVISSYVSVILTGIYSNYLIILSAVQTILEKLFSAFTASLGNLNVLEGENITKKYQVFQTMWFLNYWLYGFCGVCMFVLFEPFIKFWIGKQFLLGTSTEFVIVVNFLILGLQQTVAIHRAAYGLFYKGRYRPIFSVLVNIGTSIAFVNILSPQYGVVAVLMGTIISTISVSWWFDTWVVYTNAFGKKPYRYYVVYMLRLAFIVINCIFIKWICNKIVLPEFAEIVVYGVICVLFYNLAFFFVYRKNHECGEMKFLLQQVCLRFIKKR